MKRFIFFFVFAIFVEVLQAEMIGNNMTDENKKLIVDYHNELRKMVADGKLANQPKAIDMLELKWDDALGKVAQEWADGMKWGHNPNRSDTFTERFPVGENIYLSRSSSKGSADFDWTKAIKKWFDEHQYYTYCPIGQCPPILSATGHFTQVVWANTQYVGCGNTYYKDNESGKFVKYYVCDYGAAGNWYGEHPYKIEAKDEKLD